MRLYLNFHHHTILVECKEESVLEKIRGEFHHFLQDTPLFDPGASVELLSEAPPAMPPMVAVKLLENATVYRLGPRQYVDYFGEALTIWDRDLKKIQVFSLSSERLFELGFLAIHSLLGQALDQKGLCRVHALGVSLNNTTLLVMLPSKGGKSTLLMHFLDNPDVRIISDDMPLIDQEGRVHPFPSKISLDTPPKNGPLSELTWHEFKRYHYPAKWTASLAQLPERLDSTPMNRETLLVAGFRLSSGHSMLTEVGKWRMIPAMLEHMIMGFGLPQILELFLKFNFTDFFKMAKHALLRTRSALALLRRSKCYHFYMGPDRVANAQRLMELMHEQQDS